ncbi:hypothetical protein HUU53_02295 [Candidatus Micrarchaeota archaeon]|nr:hypothetical protein [Candidatus Micrarchaeota archaeon]
MSGHDSHGGGHSSHSSQSHGGSGDSRQAAIFIAILAVVGIIIASVLSLKIPLSTLLPVGLLAVLVIAFFPRYVEFKEYERGVVFRLGRFYKVIGPGFAFLFPYIDKEVRTDLRTQVLDIHPQEVITQDDLHLKIDVIVYYRVVDPKKAVIEIKDHKGAITNLMLSQVRNVVGKMLLEEVLEKTESINLDLYSTIKDVESAWGISTLRVEVQSIELPKGLTESFQKKREAKEFKEKIETEAHAKQIAIELLDKVGRSIDNKTLAILYVDALKQISQGKSNKIIFPLELSRLATNLSDNMNPGKKIDYNAVIQSFLESYQETKAKTLEPEEKKHKKKKK